MHTRSRPNLGHGQAHECFTHDSIGGLRRTRGRLLKCFDQAPPSWNMLVCHRAVSISYHLILLRRSFFSSLDILSDESLQDISKAYREMVWTLGSVETFLLPPPSPTVCMENFRKWSPQLQFAKQKNGNCHTLLCSSPQIPRMAFRFITPEFLHVDIPLEDPECVSGRKRRGSSRKRLSRSEADPVGGASPLVGGASPPVGGASPLAETSRDDDPRAEGSELDVFEDSGVLDEVPDEEPKDLEEVSEHGMQRSRRG